MKQFLSVFISVFFIGTFFYSCSNYNSEKEISPTNVSELLEESDNLNFTFIVSEKLVDSLSGKKINKESSKNILGKYYSDNFNSDTTFRIIGKFPEINSFVSVLLYRIDNDYWKTYSLLIYNKDNELIDYKDISNNGAEMKETSIILKDMVVNRKSSNYVPVDDKWYKSIDILKLSNKGILENIEDLLVNDSLKGVTTGLFDEFQLGDYYHLVMRSDSGKQVTYWLAVDFNEKNFKRGDKIKVYWKHVREFIPEANDTIEMQTVYKIEKQ